MITPTNSSRAAGPLPVNPRTEATVSFNFDGMEALFFGNSERVSLGILNAHNHTPKLVISKIVNDQKSTIATLEGQQLRGSLFVDVDGNNKGVGRYYSSSMNDDYNDSRWLVDFNELYSGRKFTIKEESLSGKIHFSSGLFYAANLSDARVHFFSADGSGKALPFNRRIAEPGAKINLASGEALVIKKDNVELVRLTSQPNVRYQIEITNIPPPNMGSMDHFLNFYSLVGENLTEYVPVMAQKAAFNPAPYLCIPLNFSDSELSVH
jgi:hypothetical protein